MGGCVSFNTTEQTRSELHQNGPTMQNPPPTHNPQDVRPVSTPHIEVPFFPTRMLMNGSNECASTSIGRKGAHAMVYEFLLGGVDMAFCGLFDSHGPKGNSISEKVRDNLPFKLLSEWRSILSGENARPHEAIRESNVELDESEKLPTIFAPLEQSFFEAFDKMDKDLKEDEKLDSYCSGATALTAIKKGRDLLIGNLGKSRAILGARDKDNYLVGEQLTIDLKPNLATELDRIRRCGGRVFPTKDEPNICRLFLPRNDAPGLSVSRALGDFCLKDYGLIAVPQVYYRRLARSDEFLILATHGVWDVLSNQEAVEIVASAPCKELASKALVDHVVHAWRVKDPTRRTDEISAIVLYLDMDHEDQDKDLELLYYEERMENVEHVSPPIESHEEEVIDAKLNADNSDKGSQDDKDLAEEAREQEGDMKKKKGKSIMKMPKFIKKWGNKMSKKNVLKIEGDP